MTNTIDNKNDTDIKSNDNNSINNDKQNSETSDPTPKFKWSPENEMILVEWSDIAQCYNWMNHRSNQILTFTNAWITIPSIVLSTISGTASFAQKNLPENFQSMSPLVIGGINIFVGILTTVQQYLKLTERNEAHRVSAISWGKFYRNIRIELAKHPDERIDASHFLKVCRNDFDRLMETSPIISTAVVNEFMKSFPGNKEIDEKDDLRKPDICNIIVSANKSRHNWYKALEENSINIYEHELDKKTIEDSIRMDIMKEKGRLMELEKINEEREHEEKVKKEKQHTIQREITEKSKAIKKQTKQLEEYVSKFLETTGRKPHPDEIIDNMKTIIEKEIIDRFLEKYSITQYTMNSDTKV